MSYKQGHKTIPIWHCNIKQLSRVSKIDLFWILFQSVVKFHIREAPSFHFRKGAQLLWFLGSSGLSLAVSVQCTHSFFASDSWLCKKVKTVINRRISSCKTMFPKSMGLTSSTKHSSVPSLIEEDPWKNFFIFDLCVSILIVLKCQKKMINLKIQFSFFRNYWLHFLHQNVHWQFVTCRSVSDWGFFDFCIMDRNIMLAPKSVKKSTVIVILLCVELKVFWTVSAI